MNTYRVNVFYALPHYFTQPLKNMLTTQSKVTSLIIETFYLVVEWLCAVELLHLFFSQLEHLRSGERWDNQGVVQY